MSCIELLKEGALSKGKLIEGGALLSCPKMETFDFGLKYKISHFLFR